MPCYIHPNVIGKWSRERRWRHPRWAVSFVLLLVACGTPLTPTPSTPPSRGQTVARASANPLQATPAYPDLRASLPTVGPLPTQAPTCDPGGPTLVVEPVVYPGLAGQAWAAEQIIVGTVLAQEVRWESHPIWGPTIYTYSLVRVDERVRGIPEELLVVDGYGGTLGGCTQASTSPTLRDGETALVFLLKSGGSPAGIGRLPRYHVDGGQVGLQRVSPAAGGPPTSPSGGAARPFSQILTQLRHALAQPPPSELDARFLVPLDRAPIAPQATPLR